MKQINQLGNALIQLNGGFHVNGEPNVVHFNKFVADNDETECLNCKHKIAKGETKYHMVTFFGVSVCEECVDDRLCVIA